MSNKRQNKKLETRMQRALQNTQEAREIIIDKLDTLNSETVADEKQLHLLINYKLELLDVKLRLNDMLKHLHKIK